MIAFILVILGLLSIFYYLGIGFYTSNFTGFQVVWLGIGILVFCFGILECRIVSSMHDSTNGSVDYLIVLGAQIRGTKVTKSLKFRLDASIEYLSTHANTDVIVSGGQGAGEDTSEAAAMKDYLISHGISPHRIYLEDASFNTSQNLKYSKEIIEKHSTNYTVSIVSNDFHLCRAKAIARKEGFSNIQSIAAPSDTFLRPNYMAREAIALIKDKLAGNL